MHVKGGGNCASCNTEKIRRDNNENPRNLPWLISLLKHCSLVDDMGPYLNAPKCTKSMANVHLASVHFCFASKTADSVLERTVQDTKGLYLVLYSNHWMCPPIPFESQVCLLKVRRYLKSSTLLLGGEGGRRVFCWIPSAHTSPNLLSDQHLFLQHMNKSSAI